MTLGFLCLSAGTVLASPTEFLLVDDFETGTLNPATWAYGDQTAGLAVIPDLAGSGYVLSFNSLGQYQTVGSLYELEQFAEDDVLVAQADFRREIGETFFAFHAGRKPGGTTIPSYVRSLPHVLYRPELPGENGNYTDPFYPPPGYENAFQVFVAYGTGGTALDDYIVDWVLDVGDWYTIRQTYTPTLYELEVDGQSIFQLGSSDLTYTFDKQDDWIFQIGDNSSHSYEITFLSVDNVTLIRTKQVILDIVDAFGVDFAIADALYEEYGTDRLESCLSCCSGDFAAFLECLNPTQERSGRLSFLAASINGVLEVQLMNVGSGTLTGQPRLIAGLSYDMNWVPEWETQFVDLTLPATSLRPGETLTLQIEVPEIPSDALDALTQRAATLWTDYVDRVPECDFIGLILAIGDSNEVFGFIPIPE